MSETQPAIICVKGIKTNKCLFVQLFIIFAIICNANLALERHKRGARKPCAESLKTVTTVKSCPKNKDSWERKAKLKNCGDVSQNCSLKYFVYHCILDEFGKSLIELCAETTEIIGRFCAEFSSGGMFVQEHVEKQCKSCPFAYNSNMSYLYNECYDLPELTTVIQSTTKRQRQTTQALNISEYLNTTLRLMYDEAKPEFNYYSIVISIALGLLTSILSIAVLKIIYTRKGRTSSPRDHLSSPPLMSSATPIKGEVDSPVEEHRAMITLHSNLQEDVNNRLDVNKE